MSLSQLETFMADGTPVFYIQQEHIYTSSIFEISVMRSGTYLRLYDGTMLNLRNFGTVAFWTEDEAKKALEREGNHA